MIKYPVLQPTAGKGWFSRSSVLGTAAFDLGGLCSPDTACGKSLLLDLASPKFGPNKTYIYDRSGKNNHGTISGATWQRLPSGVWVNNFDGVDDSVAIGTVNALDEIAGAFTIEAWVKVTDPTSATAQSILWKKTGYTAQAGFGAYFQTSQLYINYGYLGGAAEAGKAFTSTAWNHIVLGWNTTQFVWIINGSTPLTSNTTDVPVAGTGVQAYYGRNHTPTYLTGKMALLRVYSKAPNQTEAKSHFNAERSLFGV